MAETKLTREEIAQHAAIYRLHRREAHLRAVAELVEAPSVLRDALDELRVDVHCLHHAADQLRKSRRRPMPSPELITVLGGGQGGDKK